jgi:hypothetical protein
LDHERLQAGGGTSGKEIDDLFNGFVGAIVGGFEIAGRLVATTQAAARGR